MCIFRCNSYRRDSDSTCTSPIYLNSYFGDSTCPVSPAISFADFVEGNLRGPVDDYNTYVAEKLLKISGDYINPVAFFRRHQVSMTYCAFY